MVCLFDFDGRGFPAVYGIQTEAWKRPVGKKSAGNGFEKIVPETRSGGPVPEVAGCQSEKDGDLPEREAVIERILSGGISLPEDFSGFQEEHFLTGLKVWIWKPRVC